MGGIIANSNIHVSTFFLSKYTIKKGFNIQTSTLYFAAQYFLPLVAAIANLCFLTLLLCPQVILPMRRRRRRRRQGSPRWMRLCRCTGGTVMRRCTPAATSTPAVESTCSSLTTPIHSGAPRVFITESTTPDKPKYRQRGSRGVCMSYICVRVCRWRFV